MVCVCFKSVNFQVGGQTGAAGCLKKMWEVLPTLPLDCMGNENRFLNSKHVYPGDEIPLGSFAQGKC